MGQIIYEHPDWEQSVYWEFDPDNGWDGYHKGLDEISEHARNVENPFILVFHPAGDMPKGNPHKPYAPYHQYEQKQSTDYQDNNHYAIKLDFCQSVCSGIESPDVA